MEAANTKVVQDAYAAFKQGDVPGILDKLTDDVDWHAVIGTGAHVPFSGPRKGKAAVGEFFKQVGESETFEEFDPREYVAQGDKVVALGHYRALTKATGKRFESDFVMVFTFRNGKIGQFREFTDSAGVNAAFAR